jgi:hypothetical protein
MANHTGLYKRKAETLATNSFALRRAEGDEAAQALVQYGYEKDISVSTVALSISITEIMRIAGKNPEVTQKVVDLISAVPNRIELDLAHRITFAEATTYVNMDGETVDITVGDNLALISAVHALTGSATTYSTAVTGNPQFSKGALETAEKSFVENTYDNLGVKKMVTPDTILTTDDPNTINQVRELLFATADVTSSNAGTFNTYSNKYTHIRSPHIATTAVGAPDTTKAKRWALVASKATDFYLDILQAPTLSTPSDGNNGADILTGNWTYVVRGMHGIAIVTPRAWRISTGLGA